ncbi:MAG: hypothetical protein HYV03_08765, partial [Deltaproteobacteria bacterium]|nr:hypothetical protein [Deltaproteobacteria bacterium]
MDNPLFERLRDDACAFRPIDRAAAFRCVTDDALPLQTLVEIAAIPRHHFFGRKVQIHIINNIRNGLCPEDCGYCAQRKTATEEIPTYAMKSEEEVMKEAENAYASGAYRYCLVSSGRGPNGNGVARLANIIRAIKTRFPSLKICLSAGILKDH